MLSLQGGALLAIQSAAVESKQTMQWDLPYCIITEMGLKIDDGLTLNEWLSIGRALKQMEGAIQWFWGDWFAYGERFKGDYQQVAALTGYKVGTLKNYASVAIRVTPSRRHDAASMDHAAAVAALPPKDQLRLLAEAKQAGMNSKTLRKVAKAAKEGVTYYPAYDLLKRKTRNFEQMTRDQLKPKDAQEQRWLLNMLDSHINLVASLRSTVAEAKFVAHAV